MALTQGNKITASDFIALKNKIKAETARRKHTGSVSSHATDFSVTPSAGTKMTATQIKEVVTPLNAIAATGYTNISSGSLAVAVAVLDTQVTKLAGIGETSSSHGCNSSCTGLCYTSCATTCSGCSGSCSGSCDGCSGSCSGSCAGGCSGGCKGGCKGCTNTCSGRCQGGCSGTCTGSCIANCKSGCGNNCIKECQSSVL